MKQSIDIETNLVHCNRNFPTGYHYFLAMN